MLNRKMEEKKEKTITETKLDEETLEIVNGAGHIINDRPPFWDETNPNTNQE